jgi:anthranilate phosphoribosyltransferase
MLRELVATLAAGNHLSCEEAEAVMHHLVSGEASPALAGALLTALKIKGETAAEVTGFARGMRDHAVSIAPRCERLVDTCGTGGGSVSTFNISTTAAFVVAGAGVSVAKHGNRAITSACGSADVLEALGVRIDIPAEQICRCIEEIGIGFLFAQAHHPAMRHVGPIRRELPFRTIFNCLGPLTNPAGARAQVVGVYEPRLVPLLGEALQQLGCDRALVAHGRDSLDELSTLGETFIAEVTPHGVACYDVSPQDFGLPTATAADLAPGADARENAAITKSILAGEPGPRRDIVLLNAAAALFAAGWCESILLGLDHAAESIDSRAAQLKLEGLIEATNT